MLQRARGVLAAAFLVVCLAPGLASAAVTEWTTDPTFADAAKNFSAGDTVGVADMLLKGGGVVYWGPRGGNEASRNLYVPRNFSVTCTYDGNTASAVADAVVSINVQRAGGNGSSAGEWQPYTGSVTDGVDCGASFPCNSITLIRGTYRFVPTGTDADARLKCEVD